MTKDAIPTSQDKDRHDHKNHIDQNPRAAKDTTPKDSKAYDNRDLARKEHHFTSRAPKSGQ